MSLKESIEKDFTDQDGLISPYPCLKTQTNASNNGLCYLGEYITLRQLTYEFLDSKEKVDILHLLDKCEVEIGCFKRSSTNNQDYESVDDYYGLCSGIYFNKLWNQGDYILMHGLHNLGSYNNITPGAFQWKTFLWRNPSLLALMLWSSNRKVWFPLELIVAITIATSGLFSNQSSGTSSWLLSWFTIQVAKRESWMCNLAAKLWNRRLKKVWPNGMVDVAKVYYKGLPGQDHPFVTAFSELGE